MKKKEKYNKKKQKKTRDGGAFPTTNTKDDPLLYHFTTLTNTYTHIQLTDGSSSTTD
jgi:hypothetical protein